MLPSWVSYWICINSAQFGIGTKNFGYPRLAADHKNAVGCHKFVLLVNKVLAIRATERKCLTGKTRIWFAINMASCDDSREEDGAIWNWDADTTPWRQRSKRNYWHSIMFIGFSSCLLWPVVFLIYNLYWAYIKLKEASEQLAVRWQTLNLAHLVSRLSHRRLNR